MKWLLLKMQIWASRLKCYKNIKAIHRKGAMRSTQWKHPIICSIKIITQTKRVFLSQLILEIKDMCHTSIWPVTILITLDLCMTETIIISLLIWWDKMNSYSLALLLFQTIIHSLEQCLVENEFFKSFISHYNDIILLPKV